jgi:acyl carrier protein
VEVIVSNKIEWTDFLEKVSEYTGIEKVEINEDTNLYADLGMDSLAFFSLGMHLIKTYGVQIPLSAVATIETVKDFYSLMNEQVTKDNQK